MIWEGIDECARESSVCRGHRIAIAGTHRDAVDGFGR